MRFDAYLDKRRQDELKQLQREREHLERLVAEVQQQLPQKKAAEEVSQAKCWPDSAELRAALYAVFEEINDQEHDAWDRHDLNVHKVCEALSRRSCRSGKAHVTENTLNKRFAEFEKQEPGRWMLVLGSVAQSLRHMAIEHLGDRLDC
jgi:uncharacterized membrane protein